VATQHGGSGGIAARYAAALFELADAKQQIDRVASDLGELKAMIVGSSDLGKLLHSPVLARADQERGMAAVLAAAGAGPLVRNFVGLVARNRRLFVLPAMIDAFLAELARRRGEVRAEVTSARPLNDLQQVALTEAVRRGVGGKVAVEIKVDPGLLGGLIVKVGSRMVDSSLRTKLQRLTLAMKGVG